MELSNLKLQFICNQIAQTRRETVSGVEYLIAPTVAIKAGVLKDELVPADEIATHFHSWDGRPFVVSHPKDNDGEDISANDPALLAKMQLGWLFNTHFDNGKLKGEIWVDVNRARVVDGGPEVMARLDSGLPLEVSTAYFRDRDEEPGTFNGAGYRTIARNLRPDHLAALLDAEGACSWADGCGAPRANEEGEDVQANVRGSARNPTYDGTTSAEWSAPSLSDYLNAYPGDKPEEQQVENLSAALKRWIAGHSLLGDPAADNFRELSFFPVVDTNGKLNERALRAVLGGRGAQANIPEGAKSSAQAKARKLLEDKFGMESQTNEKSIIAAFCAWLAPVLNALGIESQQEVTAMASKQDMIKAIAADKELGLNAETLADVPTSVLAAIAKLLKQNKATEKEPASNEPEPEPEAETETQVEKAQPAANEAGSTPCVDSRIAALEARVEALTAKLSAGDEERKAALVLALAANTACAFSEERLKALAVEDLEALQRSLAPADYSGQGGGSRANVKFEPFEMPDIFAAESQEVQ